MSSLRRSGRTRISASGIEPAENGGSGGGSSMADSSGAMAGGSGSPDGSRRKRKRGSSLEAGSKSPDQATTRNHTPLLGQNGSTAEQAGDSLNPAAGADGDESPLRTRSSRKILIKSSTGGPSSDSARHTKVARGEASEQAHAATAGADKLNGLGIKHAHDPSPIAVEVQDRQERSASSRAAAPAAVQANPSASPSASVAAKAEEGPAQYDLKVESDTDGADGVEESGEERQEDVVIESEDKKKLNVVIRAFAPDLLRLRIQGTTDGMDMIDPRRRGAERRARASETLDDLLSLPVVHAGKLRQHFLKLQAPLITPESLRSHLSGSHISPSRDNLNADRRKLAAIATCLALVDEIARRARQREGQKPFETVKGHGKRPQPSNGVYALHMRLPGGEYFTNAVPLSTKEADALDPGYANLVSVSTDPIAPQQGNVPTLGQRLQTAADQRSSDKSSLTPHRRRDDDEYAKPVSHLYYGAWSSYAPTYDSFDGQLNYKASCALWRAKREDRLTLHRWSTARPSLLGSEAREQFIEVLEQVDGEQEDGALDVEAILQGYDDLPDVDVAGLGGDDVDGLLQRNATLLCWLQELQEQRWRQLLAKSTMKRYADDLMLAAPDENENAIARQLLDSLTTLLAVRPHVGDDGQGASIVPAAQHLQAIATSAMIDPALQDNRHGQGQWGTLDSTTFGPTASRRQALVRSGTARPLSAVRDNETIRLASASEEKAGLVQNQAGAGLGAARDRGTGLLDRFASTRNYRLEDHPHDRKPPVPAAPGHLSAGSNGHHGRTPGALPHGARSGAPSSPSVPRSTSGRPPYVPARTGMGTPTMSYAGPSSQHRPPTSNPQYGRSAQQLASSPGARPVAGSGPWTNGAAQQHSTGYYPATSMGASGSGLGRPSPSMIPGSPAYRPTMPG